jgi:poly-gamma-glutamate capsule biosynthesis protein CapA/YwtB (metallophosphatase superfamily)
MIHTRSFPKILFQRLLLFTLLTLGFLGFLGNCHSSTTPQSEKNEEIFSIAFGGDVYGGESYQTNSKKHLLPVPPPEGFQESWRKLQPFLLAQDEVIVNLETPLSSLPHSPFKGKKSYIHQGHPQNTLEVLKKNNITVLSLGNNHTVDYGSLGLIQTCSVLKEAGLPYFGAGLGAKEACLPFIKEFIVQEKPFTLIVCGGFEYFSRYQNWGFYAQFSEPGVHLWNSSETLESLKKWRKAYPSAFIVAFPHWGNNYRWRSETQKHFAHQTLEAGADLILGHGAHTLQEIECYQGKWICYGLGNLLFNSPGRYEENKEALPYSLVAQLRLTSKKILRLYPLESNNQKNNYCPSFLETENGKNVLQQLLQRSALRPENTLALHEGQDQYGVYLDIFLP